MSELIGLALVVGLAAWLWSTAYSSGKREGSRKGYGVGYARGKRGRSRSDCFVATAVFVRPEHPALALLRSYRDSTLRRSVPGRVFIRVYYRMGPHLAAVVRRVPPVRRPIRRLLLGWCWTHRQDIRGGGS